MLPFAPPWKTSRKWTNVAFLGNMKMISITYVSFPWQREALSVQSNHCAPSGHLPKDLSLLYVMFTLTTHAAHKSKHMALYTLLHTSVKSAVEGNSTCHSSSHVYSVGVCENAGRLDGSVPFLEVRLIMHSMNSEERHLCSKISAICKCSASNTAWSRGKMSDVPRLRPTGLGFVQWPSFLPSFVSAVSSKMKD